MRIDSNSTYHGAKNLMNTVFPSVTASKVSGVNSIALALAADSIARLTKNAICLIIILWPV